MLFKMKGLAYLQVNSQGLHGKGLAYLQVNSQELHGGSLKRKNSFPELYSEHPPIIFPLSFET